MINDKMKYMKTKHIIKTAIVMAAGILTLTSCEDWLTIYPTDKTVGDNFWVKKSDVEEMRTGAYAAVTEDAFLERVLMWGVFRSDEVIMPKGDTNTDRQFIQAGNLYPKQDACSWTSFYKVINRCNIVLNHAEEVMEKDPDFTKGDCNSVRAEMLALRAYCYFYLVRSFRDVPYTEQSYEADDVDMILPQSAPKVVLDSCISHLKEARKYIVKSGAYGLDDWRNKGYFTRDAIDALLADIYLWRGSMTGNAADYQECVNYADNVINSRDEYFRKYYPNESSVDVRAAKYHLHDVGNQYKYLFGYANEYPFKSNGYGGTTMSETILEWQCKNNALANFYNSKAEASPIFNQVATNANQEKGLKVYQTEYDLRFWNFTDNPVPDAESLPVYKLYYSNNDGYIVISGGHLPGNSDIDHNWVVYRITDVMLMKAEALVQLAADSDDKPLEQAFNLVQVVNQRSMRSTLDTLKYEGYNEKDKMELLVLAERERELCFEGKRWYDLMRYAYRKMGSVDITKCMTDDDYVIPALPDISNFLTRKFASGNASVTYKMKTEPSLYWPINRREIKVNPLLRQNPVFQDNSSTSKN